MARKKIKVSPTLPIERENWLQENIDFLNIVVGMYSEDKKYRLYISSIFLCLYNMSSILDLIFNCDTLEKYIEGLTLFLPASATLLFLYLFILNRKTLHEAVKILRTDFEQHEYATKAEIMSMRLVKYSKYYLYFVYFVYILLTLQSYWEREEYPKIHDGKACGLPGRAWYPLDLTKKMNYLLILAIQLITIWMVIFVTIPIAMCFAALLIHLRAQLFYLQEYLLRVCEIENFDEARIMLKYCIKYHIMLIRFTDTMQSAFSSILFIHNYSPSIVISVVGYQASMMSVLDPKFLPYMSTVNYVLAECFVYCYYGQHVIDQSEYLGFIAYSNKWYNCPNDIAKDLNLMLMRCQNPLRMVFMGSTSASLETYYNIVKTGYSYFMFIASMGNPNET